MCGIWGLLTYNSQPANKQALYEYVKQLEPRGPEYTGIEEYRTGSAYVTLGFTRLAINGLTHAGDQPMSSGKVHWVCNGEIYNYKDLAARHGIELHAGSSDCEVIGPLYERYAGDLTTFFRALDGVFAILIVDEARKRVVVGRDPYGVRPLFVGEDHNGYIFSSEMKGIPSLTTDGLNEMESVTTFTPGTYRVYNTENSYVMKPIHNVYHTVPFLKVPAFAEERTATEAIRDALTVAVKKRMLTERPVAALLSGGIDSSLIAALVARELRWAKAPPLKTFSIGFAGSEDLRYARMVASWIGSEHHEIVMTPDDFFAAIPEVIQSIESYDTTTVRASVGNWLVAREIRRRCDAKVVFNGDGSDEVFGSYMYFYKAPSDEAFEAESGRLLEEIHMFDVLRSDRSISSHGLEPRTPFLDKQFVATARAVATALRRPGPDRCEKWILRRAFANSGLLPNDVLWRKKEAFSDGVSGPEKLWYQHIQDRVPGFEGMTPAQAERAYYFSLFQRHYSGREHVNVPHFWMPRWIEGATDPSARTLAVYTEAPTGTTTP